MLLLRMCITYLLGCGDQIQAEHPVKIGTGSQLGGIVGLGFQNVVKGRHRKRRVEVPVQGGHEALLQSVQGLRVDLSAVGVKGGDFGNELFVGRRRVVQIFPGKDQIAAVVALEAEQAVDQRVIALLLQQGDGQKFTLGLGHFAALGIEMVDMEPVIAPFMAQICLGLGDLVGVVGEGVVDAAAVDVHVLTQMLHADAGALDMPAGIAGAPGRIPLKGLVLKFGLGEPEDKVVFVAFVGVLLHALADAHLQIILVVVVEHIVFFQLGGVEIDIAPGQIRKALVQQGRNHVDILVNAVCCRLNHIRRLDVQLLAVGKKGVGIIFCNLHDALMLPLCALEHLILAGVGIGSQVAHVGDIHDALDVVAQVAQALFQHVLHDIAAQVADMGVVVDRRAAGIHFHHVGVVGNKQLFLMGQRIVKIHFISPPSLFPAFPGVHAGNPALRGPGPACGCGRAFRR